MSIVFGDRLKACRLERGWSQKTLSERADAATYVQIHRYETGEVEPSLGNAIGLADALGVSLDWLTGRSDER